MITRRVLVSATFLMALLVASCYSPTKWHPEYKDREPEVQVIDSTAIAAFVGKGKVKFAFTLYGLRQIHWVDYTDSLPVTHVLPKPVGRDDYREDSPLFSPDGQWVAYWLDGLGADDEAYIQKLDTTAEAIPVSAPGADPHWWVDPGDGSVYVIYATTGEAINNLADGSTVRQKVDLTGDGQLVGSPDTIVNLCFKGGLSADGEYLATGYEDAFMYRISTGTTIPINPGPQTCNPGIYPGTLHPDWMMFLNFQGEQQMFGVTPGALGQHDYIFIVDATNTVRHEFVVPDTANSQWQDPEWSNHPNFFTTLMRNGDFWDGYIVRISDGQRLQFNLPDKLQFLSVATPALWIAP